MTVETLVMTVESDLQKELLLLAPKRIADLRLWRRNIMYVKIDDRPMRSGIKGQADIYGYWRGGFAIEIELKALRAKISPEQLNWEGFCKSWGVTYLRLRPDRGETKPQTLDRWILEIEARRPSSLRNGYM